MSAAFEIIAPAPPARAAAARGTDQPDPSGSFDDLVAEAAEETPAAPPASTAAVLRIAVEAVPAEIAVVTPATEPAVPAVEPGAAEATVPAAAAAILAATVGRAQDTPPDDAVAAPAPGSADAPEPDGAVAPEQPAIVLPNVIPAAAVVPAPGQPAPATHATADPSPHPVSPARPAAVMSAPAPAAITALPVADEATVPPSPQAALAKQTTSAERPVTEAGLPAAPLKPASPDSQASPLQPRDGTSETFAPDSTQQPLAPQRPAGKAKANLAAEHQPVPPAAAADPAGAATVATPATPPAHAATQDIQDAVHSAVLLHVAPPQALQATSAAHDQPLPQAVPLAGVALEIAAQAREGKSRFEIRLDPPELGRIDVRLEVDRHGQVTSRLTVERVETLDLLRRDAPQLERALQDAGLKTGDSGLQFSLRDHGSAGRDDQQPRHGAQHFVLGDDEAQHPEAAARLYGRALGASGVDIRV